MSLFTSKILIKTSNIVIGNQAPLVEGQFFILHENNNINQLIGKVVAKDPDAGQTLEYTITLGNERNFFYLDHLTGDIYAKEKISYPMIH